MLYADKRALETNLKVNLLAIREKELNYYVRSGKNSRKTLGLKNRVRTT